MGFIFGGMPVPMSIQHSTGPLGVSTDITSSISTTKGRKYTVFSCSSLRLQVIFRAVSQLSWISSSFWMIRILSTDAHKEQEGLLPHPSKGTLNTNRLSLLPAVTYLQKDCWRILLSDLQIIRPLTPQTSTHYAPALGIAVVTLAVDDSIEYFCKFNLNYHAIGGVAFHIDPLNVFVVRRRGARYSREWKCGLFWCIFIAMVIIIMIESVCYDLQVQ